MTLMLGITQLASAASIEGAAPPSDYDNERYLLIGFNIFLLLINIVLAKSVVASTLFKREQIKKAKSNSGQVLSIALLATLFLSSSPSWGQEVAVEVAKEPHWISYMPADVIVLGILACIQFIIVLYLVKIQIGLVIERTEQTPALAAKESKWKKWFIKLNGTVAVEQEDELDLNHDYDGIRELDNKIPSWWLYAFYGTIIFAGVYMYRMFISETLPDQITELQEDYRIAEIKMKEYLKNAANNVDENTVVMLDAAGIESGKRIYLAKGCAACHGEVGEGNAVGPNLTDDYWLHKGSINDIFYSIKYGWPDKGMKSWQADMSPVEIAQVASYIKSLKGSNPPNAKEPQGELYVEESESSPVSDSTATAPVNSVVTL